MFFRSKLGRPVLVALIAFAVAAFATSGRRRIAPEWTVEVRDESGRPVPGVSVGQFFNDYTLAEGRNPWEGRCTDSLGRVVFPPRATWAWPGLVIIATVAKIPAFFNMCPPSFGTAASVSVRTGTSLEDSGRVSDCNWYTTSGGGAARLSTCVVRSGWAPPYRCTPGSGGSWTASVEPPPP